MAGNFNMFDRISILPNFNYAHTFDTARDSGLGSLEKFSSKIFRTTAPQKFLELVAEARKKPTFESLAREGKLPPITYIEPPFQLAPCDDHPPHDILAGQAFGCRGRGKSMCTSRTAPDRT